MKLSEELTKAVKEEIRKDCWHEAKTILMLTTDKKFVDLDTYGLFVKKDLSNVKEIVEKINEIDANKSLKKKYLECSFEITKKHCDSQFIFQNLIDNVLKIEKTKQIKTKALF